MGTKPNGRSSPLLLSLPSYIRIFPVLLLLFYSPTNLLLSFNLESDYVREEEGRVATRNRNTRHKSGLPFSPFYLRETHTHRYIWQEIFFLLPPPNPLSVQFIDKKKIFVFFFFFLRETFLSCNQSPRTNSYRNCWLRHKHVRQQMALCVHLTVRNVSHARRINEEEGKNKKNNFQSHVHLFSLFFFFFF